MASAIDTALPKHGTAFDDVRAQLATAKAEITALQGAIPPGGLGWKTVAKAGAYNAVAWDYVLATVAAPWTVTLPAANLVADGTKIGVKRISVDGPILTVASAGGTVEGVAVRELSLQYETLVFVSDGTNWWIES